MNAIAKTDASLMPSATLLFCVYSTPEYWKLLACRLVSIIHQTSSNDKYYSSKYVFEILFSKKSIGASNAYCMSKFVHILSTSVLSLHHWFSLQQFLQTPQKLVGISQVVWYGF